MLFDEKHEPKPSAFVSDEQFELSECNPNGLKCSVLWWLITSYHAVFKLRSGLLSKCRVKTFSSHLGLRTTCHLFCWYCFGLFCIIWGKNGLHNGTELQRRFFFSLLCNPLVRFQQGEKQTVVTEGKTYIQNKNSYFKGKNCEKLQW